MTDPDAHDQMKDFGAKCTVNVRQAWFQATDSKTDSHLQNRLQVSGNLKGCKRDVPLLNQVMVSKSSFFIESKTFLRSFNGFNRILWCIFNRTPKNAFETKHCFMYFCFTEHEADGPKF